MEYIPGLKKAFIVVLSICVFLFVYILLVYNNDFFENRFDIEINGTFINARYRSDFSELLFVKNTSENHIRSYVSTSELLNEIHKSDKYILTFKEYEAYSKYNNRDSFSTYSHSTSFKEVTDSKATLKIERLGKVLYEGELISDLSNILTEEGRYYFHIYNKSKRTSTPFARVKTTLTFNVLVVAYDN